MLADIAMNLELSRLMTYRSAFEVGSGRSGSYYSSMAKCFAADSANLAATNAVQIFGGQFLKIFSNLKLIFFGAVEVCKLPLLATQEIS